MTKFPPPVCKWGYTDAQIREIMGDRYAEFVGWMSGQTMALCDGLEYNHDKREYIQSCEVGHGPVTYGWDILRFLEGLPVID
jgi:hypothetical protein